jgi:hypothetical protein
MYPVNRLVDPATAVNPGTKAVRHFLLVAGERRTEFPTGPKALMLAVLEDGIRSYFSPDTRVRHEAERWINARDARHLFSFTVVCETLDLKPSRVSKGLRRWRDQVRATSGLPTKVAPLRASYRRAALGGTSGSLRGVAQR